MKVKKVSILPPLATKATAVDFPPQPNISNGYEARKNQNETGNEAQVEICHVVLYIFKDPDHTIPLLDTVVNAIHLRKIAK